MQPDIPPAEAPVGTSENPLSELRYPGIHSFEDDDLNRLLFFGRQTETELLFHKILVEDLIVLYSRSGLGKTSLLNAGILKLLRDRGFLPLTCRVYTGKTEKQTDPLSSLYISIHEGFKKAREQAILAEYSEGKKRTLWEYFKTLALWSSEDILLTPVIILDQFEELFTQYGPETRQPFVEQLGDLIRGTIPKSLQQEYLARTNSTEPIFTYSASPPHVKILISLREEYLGHLAELSRDIPTIRKNEFRLPALDRQNAELAIVLPAEMDKSRITEAAQKNYPNIKITDSFAYDDEKLKEILDFLCNPEKSSESIEPNEVDPTQLQILCQYIEGKVREHLAKEPRRKIVVDDTFLPGKNEMRSAIQNFYNRVISKFHPTNEKQKVENLIENGLISQTGKRLSLAQSDIQHRFHVSADTLQELKLMRLLKSDFRLGDFYYELSHDTLIKPIQEAKRKRSEQKKLKRSSYIYGFITLISIIGVTLLWISNYYKQQVITQQQNVIRNIQIPLDQFDKLLKERIAEIQARLPQANPREKEILLKEKAEIEAKYENLIKAKEEMDQKLSAVSQALEDYQKKFPSDYIAQAREALSRGDTKVAEKIFKEAYTKAKVESNRAATEGAMSSYTLGHLAENRIDYTLAFTYYKEAVRLEPDKPAYLNAAGLLLLNMGKYTEASPYLQDALKLRKNNLPPDHPDVAESLNNLAALYRALGKYDSAEPILQQALQIREKSLGPDHPNVAASLNNLAELYRVQGRYEKAEPLYQRALKIMDGLGPDHSAFVQSLNNLAALYITLGKFSEAEPLLKRALEIKEKTLGPEHPEGAASLNNLAWLYEAQGRYAQAETLYQRSLKIREKVFGPEHPLVAQSLENLAAVYSITGKLSEAEPLLQRALQIREKVLGPEHPLVAQSLKNLSALYNAQGDHRRAFKIINKIKIFKSPDFQLQTPAARMGVRG